VVAKLTNFASKSGVNIEGFSEKTAELLFDVFKVKDFSDLYALDREEVSKLEGYKEAKTSNLFDAIELSKKVPYSNFIYALGIDNVGKKTAKDLAKEFKQLDDLMSADLDRLLSVQDVGEIVAKCILEYFASQENLAEITKLFDKGLEIVYETNEKVGVFAGEKVVLTGTLIDYKRDDAAKIIESLGGEVLSGVSKKTTIVLAGENAGSKLDKARSLGIKIIDEETFKAMIEQE
jgi:DNA ligase (NAD+)